MDNARLEADQLCERMRWLAGLAKWDEILVATRQLRDLAQREIAEREQRRVGGR